MWGAWCIGEPIATTWFLDSTDIMLPGLYTADGFTSLYLLCMVPDIWY
jgi:hypothetical protein